MQLEKLLNIREDAELKQEEMAEILKTTQSNYSRWEGGKELIPLRKLNLLCNYFNIRMDYVIGISAEKDGFGKFELDAKTIGMRLKIVRKRYHISQKELADLLHTSQSTVSAYESGKTILLTAFALQIVKTFEISLDWLCGRSTKMKEYSHFWKNL